jgi:hypothetical protein
MHSTFGPRALLGWAAVLLTSLPCAAFAQQADKEKEDSPAADQAQIERWLELTNNPVSISPVLLAQMQAIPYVGEGALVQTGDAAERPGFRVRRARIGVEGRVAGKLHFALSAEMKAEEDATIRLHDAYIGYVRCDCFGVFAGLDDVPFSRSMMGNAGETAMTDRALAVRSLAPAHQLGMRIEGHPWDGKLSYWIGAYNGFSRTDQFFSGYVENAAALGNRFDGLAIAGRIGSEPMGKLGASIADLAGQSPRVGVAASYFFSNGGTRKIQGIGADALFHARGFHVLGEFLMNKSDLRAVPTEPTSATGSVTSYGIVGEAGYTFRGPRLGVAGRFELFDPNTDVKDESDGWAAGGGLSYYIFGNAAKAQLEYTHREEMHGKSVKNDAVVLQLQLGFHGATP